MKEKVTSYGSEYMETVIEEFTKVKPKEYITPESWDKPEVVYSGKKEIERLVQMGDPKTHELDALLRHEILSFAELDSPNALFKEFGFTDMEVEHLGQTTLELMILNMRIEFLKRYKLFLNILVSTHRYAEFKDVNYLTVIKWINKQKLDVIQICGYKFIVIPVEEILAYDKWMLRKALDADPETLQEQANRLELVRIYNRKYATEEEKQVISTQPNHVREWIEFKNIVPLGFGATGDRPSRKDGGARFKFNTVDAYKEYCEWAKKNDKTILSMICFSKRITELGFFKFTSGKRGFFYYLPIPDHLKEFYQ